MNHTPKWRTWEGGAGNIWVGYADEASGFQIPRAAILYKGTLGGTKEEAVTLGQEMAIALNAYPALVAACRAALKVSQLLPKTDYEVIARQIRDALAAAGADKPEDYGIDPEYEAIIADVGLHRENAQAMSDPLPLLDGTIQED